MIRYATIRDFDRIMEMMKNFANASPLDIYHNPKYNERSIKNILVRISQNGCILVADDSEGIPRGMVIAAIEPDLWLSHIRVLREIAWWVEPEYRKTTMGYRLIREYMRTIEKLKENNLINYGTLATLTNSPIRDMERWGWRGIQQQYILGEA